MKSTHFILIVVMLLLSGCSGTGETKLESEPEENFFGIRGTVVKIEGEGVLVTSPNTDAAERTTYDATWLSGIRDQVELGQQVEVAYDGTINLSQPARAAGTSVRLLEDEAPRGAVLTRAEAVRTVLEMPEVATMRVPSVLDVSYDDEQRTWEVQLLDNKPVGVAKINVQIEDKTIN